MSHFFTRARLRRDVPACALRELLLPRGESARAAVGHRVIWTLFADSPERTRDFLWRESDHGVFYILSRRPPADPHGLFELSEPKAYAPAFRAGDRLRFALRANATIARKDGAASRGKPRDIVMNSLYDLSYEERAMRRRDLMESAGRVWLRSRGERNGFSIGEGGDVQVTGYRTLRVPRKGASARLGVLDFEGVLEVTEPGAFFAAVTKGLGRAKAFGCGLLLLRRA